MFLPPCIATILIRGDHDMARLKPTRIVLVLIACAALPPLLGVDASGYAAQTVQWATPHVQGLILAAQRFPETAPLLLARGLEHSPIAVIGVAVALIVPLIALVAFANHPSRAWRRRRRDAVRKPGQQEFADAAHGRAWIELAGDRNASLELSREVVHIGRGRDNDLRLADPAIGTFHAIIRRTPEAEYVILDVSGFSGSGIAVNGQRFASASLRDGDSITVGNAQMTFHRAGYQVGTLFDPASRTVPLRQP
jgi:hypothetical protein